MCLIGSDFIFTSVKILFLNNSCKYIFCAHIFLIGSKCYQLFSFQPTDWSDPLSFTCGLDWHSKYSCWETAKEIVWHTTWGDNVKELPTVDETVTLAIMGCEKNMLLCVWELWGKFLFYFLHDLLKTDPRTSQKLLPIYQFVKWSH